MNSVNDRDILETEIYKLDRRVLEALLTDHSTGGNIKWASDNYVSNGPGYGEGDAITVARIVRKNGYVVQPRVDKSAEVQRMRSVEKAEVFTPSWVCNAQNNLVDAAWFGTKEAPFNKELDTPDLVTGLKWRTKCQSVKFARKRKLTWDAYVTANRMEITCGEAPYLVSRYDTVTGKFIANPMDRIGLLDRKLRVVSENVNNRDEWCAWTLKALKATYGFEYQGDSLLIARENLLWSVKDWYESRFSSRPIDNDFLLECAKVIAWNLWQMDGLKFVVPNSCHPEEQEKDLFGQVDKPAKQCPGCLKNDVERHNGRRCRIMDWETGKTVYFKPPFDFKPAGEADK